MQTGPDGIKLIQHFESCSLIAYPDPQTGGLPWTIGWGDTGRDVVPGMTITRAEADRRFAARLADEFEPMVNAAVQVELTQRQFDALVSIVYNVGPGGPRKSGIIRLQNGYPSTLLREVNDGDFRRAADEFMKWVSPGSNVERGLRRRRAAERAVFNGMPADAAIVMAEAE
jgi:lysozyme